jgi:Uma2 family endonuclease
MIATPHPTDPQTQRRADRVLLHGLSWQQFENLLRDLGDHRIARLAYCDGTLEITIPLPEHEYFKQSISIAIEDIAETLEQNYESYGSTTWRRQVKQAGLEPDNCFYFQNEARIRGQLDFDLNHDPPPDLALEIDMTSKSLDRFPIYVCLGVPELWCYDEGILRIYLLQGEVYTEQERSSIFPGLDVRQLPQIILEHREQGRLALRKAVRVWVKEQVKEN